MPSEEQWMELYYYCKWKWTGEGYQVEGRNGNVIFLPAERYISIMDTMAHTCRHRLSVVNMDATLIVLTRYLISQ